MIQTRQFTLVKELSAAFQREANARNITVQSKKENDFTVYTVTAEERKLAGFVNEWDAFKSWNEPKYRRESVNISLTDEIMRKQLNFNNK